VTYSSIPSEGKINEITISFPTNAFFVSGIRDFTFQLVKNMTGFSEQWAFRFQSVVDELCNNAIEHGSQEGEHVVCTFRCRPHDRFELIVEDTGTGPENNTIEEMNAIVENQKDRDVFEIEGIRKRGLSHIVLPLVDKISFEKTEQGGLRVHIFKFFQNT